jgi:hypothetical protein
MKNKITLVLSIAIIAIAFISSCKKKDTTNNTSTTTTTTAGTTSGTTTGNTTSGTTTSGTTTSSTTGGTTGSGTNNLQNNQWSVNGKVYTASSNPAWSKDIHGISSLTASATSGDTTILIYFRMPNYLMSSGNYNIELASNTVTTNKVNVGISKSVSSPFYYSFNYVTTGGDATITNSNGEFKIECSNAGLNSVSLTAKLNAPIPTIPVANANFTVPSGFTANQFTLAGSNYTLNQLTVSIDNGLAKVEGDVVTNNSIARGFKFWFTNSYPPSGTYDIVGSKGAVVPGKVFIEYVNLSPTELYQSPAGGTITVITDANDVSVTTSNITLNKLFGTGSATISLTGNITH